MGGSGFDHVLRDKLPGRRRRSGAAMVGNAVAVAVIAAGAVVLGQGGDERADHPAVATPDPTPSATDRTATIPEDSTGVEDEVSVAVDHRAPAGAESLAGDDIPDDFPLGLAHEDLTGDGGTVTGPGPDVPGAKAEPVCGTTLWSVRATDRLGFSSTGPAGYADVRELRTFADADDAVDQVNQIRTMMAGCHRELRSGTAIRWTLYAEDTGYDSVTFGSTYREGLGGIVFQVTRVGRSMVVLARRGEWSPETAPHGAAELTPLTREIAPSMCTFTDAGC